ncbi:molybdopterin cofactor-binding domain-containing protein [Desulfococcus multivorans]|uniref:Aldehyde oxidase and xanthine dehydrogenase molybdopterin binding protein n=1 Tax=Desulfococcus multivorans DSM 2059 TaxID=1121405 RepID=S7TU72_DESML|nr:molybdopterin cofactor-binding domain-containing protein [Desulfococcus multivorans]AOY60452.1 XdhA: predicted xanthine dehydrogenase, molybdenum-binding subunit [Desulfococcus multivorans]AQV02545.1 xanthine dehydrogenase [Desulfococcus multivorans]EPR40270.1 aldehyde oxidase and xanthine dehydrogenase molybdopterin binding protein [Desulfococcus multivorans DSM 2059]SJZ61838.1 xanthine dehydrogenase large subunit [Desulfococcus multivorans DSM 2059]
MKNRDVALHLCGESRFVDDIVLPPDTLHAFPLVSGLAHGVIQQIDVEAARALEGVLAVLTAADIAGANHIGNAAFEEELLANREVLYCGQPIAVIAAKSAALAREAAALCRVAYQPLEAVFDARRADALGLHFAPPRTFVLGDVDRAWAECAVIVEGVSETGAQEHVYLEPQTALAYPLEDGGLKILSATQSPALTQKIIARILAKPMHLVEVDVLRLGGAFGGKEEQATTWAALAALAADQTGRPVKLALTRSEDMAFTGKRHPYSADFKIGLTRQGRILAYQVKFYQNAGAITDLSLAVLERTLFHANGGYFIPNLKATAVSCRTNLRPNTAFRGFGAPQAMFVLESAIFAAARKMGVDPAVIQQQNLLSEGDSFPYGMKAENARGKATWHRLQKAVPGRREAIEDFNRTHRFEKKAVAFMPLCFGISFTSIFLNQAGALVHIYTDGSVSISCGAVEMGQGVTDKLTAVAARVLSISENRIKIESTNTTRIANMSPTAASTGADMNGQAVWIACRELLGNLKKIVAETLAAAETDTVRIQEEVVYLNNIPTNLTWTQLIGKAYMARVPLSAHAFYATPNLYFDCSTETGRPFAYHVYGCAAVEVTLDCLRGRYRVDRVRIVHDGGKSLDVLVDTGQIEGAVLQGLGWLTSEEMIYRDNGMVETADLSTYKIPDIHAAPEIETAFLGEDHPDGLFRSKAVGEPPLMYAIAVYFALAKAVCAFRPDWEPVFAAPFTPEKVLMALYRSRG